MFKELGERVESTVLDGIGKASSRVQENKPLRADLLESEDHFLAVFDAPGATSEDVEVRFDAGTVKVRIDRFRDFYEGFDMRVPGRGLSLHGSVDLPDDDAVDARAADAMLTRTGTLRVRIPKVEDSGPVTVDTREEDEATGVDTTETSVGRGSSSDEGAGLGETDGPIDDADAGVETGASTDTRTDVYTDESGESEDEDGDGSGGQVGDPDDDVRDD